MDLTTFYKKIGLYVCNIDSYEEFCPESRSRSSSQDKLKVIK